MSELPAIPVPGVTLPSTSGPIRTTAPERTSFHERPAEAREVAMRQSARAFETVFLTEMLKHSGVGKMGEHFNGGAGEAAFTDMLTQEYAREITRSGGVGLAEQIFQAMKRIEGQR